ncbi:MAG: tetratricopeptide repeat protein [Candidatus Helarchaeota archaeon]
MSELSDLTDKIKDYLKNIKVPRSISPDIKFKISNKNLNEIYELIKKRFNLLLKGFDNYQFNLNFELKIVRLLAYFKKYNDAIKYLKLLAKKFPNNELIMYHRVNIEIIKGNFQKALEMLKNLVKLNPNNAQYYNELGVLYRRIGNLDLAIKFMKIAVKKNPNHAEAWRNLGILLMESNDINAAIKYFQKALEINPKYITAMNFLALCYYSQKKYDLAIKILKKALKINPKFIKGWENLAYIYIDAEKYQDAIHSLEKILEIDKDNLDILFKIVEIYSTKIGDHETALKLLEDVKKHDDKNARIWYYIGLVNYHKGDKLKAEKCFSKAIEIAPEIASEIPDII